MKKKIFRVISSGLLICILLFSIIKIKTVNETYENPVNIVYTEGEKIVGNNLSISVYKSELLSSDKFEEKYGEMDDAGHLMELSSDSQDMMVLLIDFLVENTGKEEVNFVGTDFIAESGAWANGWSMEMFIHVNNSDGVSIPVKPNEKIYVKFPFCAYSTQFKKDSWDNIKKREFYVVLSSYPVKNKIKLEPEIW